MVNSSKLIENILPLDDLKDCMVSCYSFIELLENQKNDFILDLSDKMKSQKIDYQFLKCKGQILQTLKGFYDLIEIISVINQATQENSIFLSQVHEKLDQCSNDEQKNYKLVLDATQKLYNSTIVQFTKPCFDFFSEFINLDFTAATLDVFLQQIESIGNLCEKYEFELGQFSEEISLALNKMKDLRAIVLLLKKNILKT